MHFYFLHQGVVPDLASIVRIYTLRTRQGVKLQKQPGEMQTFERCTFRSGRLTSCFESLVGQQACEMTNMTRSHRYNQVKSNKPLLFVVPLLPAQPPEVTAADYELDEICDLY